MRGWTKFEIGGVGNTGFPISILVVGGALLPTDVGTWCRRCGEQRETSGGSSLYQLMSTYWHLQ